MNHSKNDKQAILYSHFPAPPQNFLCLFYWNQQISVIKAEWKINLTMFGRLVSPILVCSRARLLDESSTHENLEVKKKQNF